MKIYKCALEILPELKREVVKMAVRTRYIEVPFMCDGVIDRLVYDTQLGLFTKVRYSKGKGQGVDLPCSMNKFSSYYDETEICEFNLPLIQ